MNKTILTTVAALVVSAGAAFAAGGDHFPPYEPATTAAVDYGTTASISEGQKDNVVSNEKVQGSDRGVFGR
jgi:hypothetical protein